MSLVPVSALVRLSVAGNPLAEGLVRSGSVELRPDFVVECGRSFVWWREGQRSSRLLCRVVAAGAQGVLPARCIVLTGGRRECLAFASELELWVPPRGRPSFAGRARLRALVGDPLR